MCALRSQLLLIYFHFISWRKPSTTSENLIELTGKMNLTLFLSEKLNFSWIFRGVAFPSEGYICWDFGRDFSSDWCSNKYNSLDIFDMFNEFLFWDESRSKEHLESSKHSNGSLLSSVSIGNLLHLGKIAKSTVGMPIVWSSRLYFIEQVLFTGFGTMSTTWWCCLVWRNFIWSDSHEYFCVIEIRGWRTQYPCFDFFICVCIFGSLSTSFFSAGFFWRNVTFWLFWPIISVESSWSKLLSRGESERRDHDSREQDESKI